MEANTATSGDSGMTGLVPEDQSPGTPTADGGKPAGLAPLPYDGVGSIAVGTVVWLIALIVMIPFADDLREDGHLWWLATSACGFGLGLLGLVIVVRRRARIRRGEIGTGN